MREHPSALVRVRSPVPRAGSTITSFLHAKGVDAMSQHGQLMRLERAGPDGEPLWAYRYRMGGRGSKRMQRGGFVSERDAAEALERELENGCGGSGEFRDRSRSASWWMCISRSTTWSR
jgi:hypothetical protein